jgi:5-bromo-4-chloroindolyl phosphate hydrolysis protein
MSVGEAEARQKEKFMQTIRNIEACVVQTEEELTADAVELADLRAVGSLLEQEGLDKDEEAHAKIRVHLEDAKEKLKALRKTWTESYGPWVR